MEFDMDAESNCLQKKVAAADRGDQDSPGQCVPDYAPEPLRATKWDVIVVVFSIMVHALDVATDINVAYQYYRHRFYSYFIATIVINLVPAFVNTCVSWRMYVLDGTKVSCNRSLLLLFQLASFLRYFDSLKYAVKSRSAERRGDINEQIRYYRLMVKEDADLALLRVIESFLEAAPQQILQISFLLRGEENPTIETGPFSVYHQVISIGSSLIGMAWSLMSYHRNIRFAQEDKDNISNIGSIVMFVWHFFVTVSRIMVISAMVSLAWNWTMLSASIHWIVMTFSLSVLDTPEFCTYYKFGPARCFEQVANFLFSVVLGLVFIFTYITPGEGSTFCRHLWFYTICFFENVAGAVVWTIFVKDSTKQEWFFIPVTAICIASFILGCLFMILYYKKFHPTRYRPRNLMPQLNRKSSSSIQEKCSPSHLPENEEFTPNGLQ